MPPAAATKQRLPRMSRAEYLAFEEKSEQKHEFHDGEVLAMSGGTFEHSTIAANIGGELRNRLRAGSCSALESNMRVWIPAARRYVYPDVTVYCGRPEFDPTDGKRTTLLNPTAIFEVLSDSTAEYDRGDKFIAYRSVESLREYVLIAQDKPQVEVFFRNDDGNWRIDTYQGLDAIATLRSINVELPLAEIYLKVEFAPPAEG